MKLNEINIRDPFVLVYGGKYYMYGTRAKYTWGDGKAQDYGFDAYISDDLENWSDAIPVFEYYDEFYGACDFWAPEVHLYKGKFYMLASFRTKGGCRGTAILVSDTPDGKFKVHSNGVVTPTSWECLDGTLYIENEKPYMVFCHEWTQIKNGEVCSVELSPDLTHAVTEPRVLWTAADATWRDESYLNGAFVTDGPFLIKQGDELLCIWSSFYRGEYCEAISRSDNGKIGGSWTIDNTLLYEKNGGHGMIFSGIDNTEYFIFHSPNETPLERPVIKKIKISELFNK